MNIDTSKHTGERRSPIRRAMVIAFSMFVVAGVVEAAPATADFASDLQDAVMQVRSGQSCGQLRADPLAAQTAEVVARTTSNYLNHDSRVAPGRVNATGQLIVEPLSILKDLGSSAGKAKSIEGAGKTQADAIKSLLITGFADIPDCSYSDFGVGAMPNDNPDGYFLTALVLAGA